MYEQLHIESFRGLRDLKLVGLRRVNLLVGANNCGKTSVLEAVHLLAGQGNVLPLISASARRGEFRDGSDGYEIDVAHLVHGREIEEGAAFRIGGIFNNAKRALFASFQLAEEAARLKEGLFVDGGGHPDAEMSAEELVSEAFPLELKLEWTGGSEPRMLRWSLTRHQGITPQMGLDIRRRVGRPRSGVSEDDTAIVEMVSTEGLVPEKVTELFDSIALTSEETLVTETLRTIEPGIERIALSKIPRRFPEASRAGIRLSINGQRVPIGSMGDGMWRILGIALSLVGARGGILLVDEIDTGLHYSVLTKVWRLLLDTSRRLGVQVFATTHSRDCVEALAEIAQDDGQDISLQRIERGKPQAVPFSEAAIRRAAERGIEVR
jgi:hypothetical protein